MKIVITGAGGFLGSHLVPALLKRGHSVSAVITYDDKGHTSWASAVVHLAV